MPRLDSALALVRRLVPRGTTPLVAASIGSQLCTFAAIPFVSRWCGPQDFGLLQLYITLITIAGLVASLRFDYALLQPELDAEARGLWTIGAGASFGIGCLAWLALPGLSYWQSTAGWEALRDLGWAVGLAVALTGMSSGSSQWLIRKGNFNQLARARVIQSIATASIQLSLAYLGAGGKGLILADVAGRTLGLVILVDRGLLCWSDVPRVRDIVRVAFAYQRFPKVSVPSAMINAVGFSLPVFFIERAFGTHGVGVFSLLERIMGIPTLFLGQPLSQTFTHRLREAMKHSKRRARGEVFSTSRTAAILGIFPFVALAVAGPWLVTLVFGPQWHDVGHLAQLLAVPYFVAYAVWPVMPTLTVMNRLRTQMTWDTSRALALLAIGWLASRGHFSLGSIVGFVSIVMASFGVLHFYLCQRAAANP
ncbi:MAG: oligosaccharide flippase family protein [Opitutaceae bacterium]|nr:oligosaccharide flippase family protein [Opitutaceae bacterium]